MLKRRIIPCLDIKNGRVVKGVHFAGLRDAGDPVEAARAYDQQGADEICLLDITATTEGRVTFLEIVERVAAQIFCPLTVGGGIRREDDVRRLLNAGADKVAINSAAVSNPPLVENLAAKYGSQCIVGAVDVRRLPPPRAAVSEPSFSITRTSTPSSGTELGLTTASADAGVWSSVSTPFAAATRSESASSWGTALETSVGEGSSIPAARSTLVPDPTAQPVQTVGTAGSPPPREDEDVPLYEVVIHAGTRSTGLEAVHWCQQLAALGAGELLITSMDRDGTRDGYDLHIIHRIADAVPIPIIASGGVGTLEHLREGLANDGAAADAALAASIFHFGLFTIAQAKQYLLEHGIPVRAPDETLPGGS